MLFPLPRQGDVNKAETEAVNLILCAKQPLWLEELEQLFNRSADFLLKRYQQPQLKAKRLKPNHLQQAYQKGETEE